MKKLQINVLFKIIIFIISIFITGQVYAGIFGDAAERAKWNSKSNEEKDNYMRENHDFVPPDNDLKYLKHQIDDIESKTSNSHNYNTSTISTTGNIKDDVKNDRPKYRVIKDYNNCTGEDGKAWVTNSICRTRFNLLAKN